VAEAMRVIDRQGFLPADQQAFADGDYPLPIGFGQTNSQPSTVAAMLELLDVAGGHDVLDVGAGSGWTTALLAHLVGPSGSVVGVELVPELAAWGAQNLARFSMPWAALHAAADRVLGWPESAPYDRIMVSAGAKQIPDSLVQQLRAGGVLVIAVSGRMLRVRRAEDPEQPPEVTRHGMYRFVPLRESR